MTEENLGWIFIDKIPLLYSEKNVKKQLKVEEWLDLYQLSRELRVPDKAENSESKTSSSLNYVV